MQWDASHGVRKAILAEAKLLDTVEQTIVEKTTSGIVFNPEQEAAISAAVSAISSGTREFVISGKAGTGKTTIVNEILRRSELAYGDAVGIAAVAHKAKETLLKKIDSDVKERFAFKA